MTDEEIAEMRRRVANAKLEDEAGGSTFGTDYWHDVSALLAERAALLAEVEQWRSIGHTLDLIGRDATGAMVTDSLFITDCPLCHKRITGPVDDEPRWPSLPRLGHRDDCLVVKARALLEEKQS